MPGLQNPLRRLVRSVPVGALGLLGAALAIPTSHAAETKADSQFKKEIQPILAEYCYDCHADGAKKGQVAFDIHATELDLVNDHTLWHRVIKNVRAGVMPPPKKAKPSAEEIQKLEKWIKAEAFKIDPSNPDPGRVTLRRLNRTEYRNTIRDLMGVEFKTEEEFPPDDTGYGFDNIGDVLSVSPILLEKYMQAANTIVTQGVPVTSRQVGENVIAGMAFRKVNAEAQGNEGEQRGPRRGARGESMPMSFYEPHTISYTHRIQQAGTYKLLFDVFIRGDFNFDPGRVKFVVKINDEEAHAREFGWDNGKKHVVEVERKWEPGEYKLTIDITPLTDKEQRRNALDMRISALTVRGPIEPEKWARPKNFDRFFTKDAPADEAGRREYAREVLTRFTTKAFRRPADAKTVDRLVAIAETAYTEPGKTFEQGVGQAILAILASPRFLFRIEDVQPTADGKHPLVDEYALASRLSYFLWSTMPDDELFTLAQKGELRKNLQAQVKRLLDDQRSDTFIENFAGQWLEARDVDGINIDSRSVLARDAGTDKELAKIQEELRVLRAKREAETAAAIKAGQPVQRERGFGFGFGSPEEQALRQKLRGFMRGPTVELDGTLKGAMRRETEMFFEHVMREDKSILDFLDSDYTFLNERLAKHYGIPEVTGEQMRKVQLAPDSVRGGLITHGSVLVVTSNPTRTSPVKRGLFILDNILGASPPPPPPDVPALEEAEQEFKDKEPTLRETLELHRSKPLCSSCHDRMDPLGLVLENFNALGMYRETERKLPIDTAGKLITGEEFKDIRGLKKVLRTSRHMDFYRCLTEKLMTYALGRGLEYYDVQAVDQIVEQLEKDGGKFSTLLTGVIESAPFQRRRAAPVQTAGTN